MSPSDGPARMPAKPCGWERSWSPASKPTMRATRPPSVRPILPKASAVRPTRSLRRAARPMQSRRQVAADRTSIIDLRCTLRSAAPRCGAGADHRGKYSREVALIGKARRYCNLRQRQVAHAHQLLGRVHALAQQPLVRRQAGRDAERAREMADRKIEIRRDLLQRDFTAEIGFEFFASALHLPGRKTAAGQF